ncbi:MAG: TonB-dependent receptor [Alphaproteobacteria bacterium]|nr:TonB-dependent receptor [Alphaproteobacteria bacterium]
MLLNRLMSGVAFSALAVGLASQAFAQSTGTQEVEKVVVTGQKNGTGGVIVKEQRPKTRSTVTQDYLKTQPSGQTVFQSLNLVPGLNFTNSDPYGASGGNVRLRGFDGNRISLTQDGIPLNDTGNYAIFTNQQIDAEYIQRATVNTGTTDVDSPTASATGGTINVITRKPYDDLTFSAGTSFGSFNYQRFIGIIDSGEYRGTSAFAGLSFQEYDKFKGPGELQKTQANARIYQEIGENSFISLVGHYNENRNNFYRNLTKAQINQFGDSFDNFATCTRDAANGVVGADGLPADNVQNDGFGADANNLINPASCTNFYNLRINPSNTGNIRAQMNFALTDSLRLTIDPSWQYVKANGGGTTVVSETDRRLTPAGLPGTFVDLNGDGDGLDQIRTYSPSNTNTSRYGLTASLIWEIDLNNSLRVAYTGDHGRHRQTGAFGRISADGTPFDIFGGLDSETAKIRGLDGNALQARDRLSHAILNQVAVSYVGRFFNEKLLVDIGVRAPYFSRDLNQNCFTQVNAANTVRCTTEPFTDPDNDGIGTLAGGGANRFIRPYSTSFDYDALLPNLGVSYEIFDSNIIYASYAEGLSAPRTDNLYYAAIVRQGAEVTGVDANVALGDPLFDGIDTFVFPGVQPEKTKSFDLGYRFQGETVTASAALWYNQYENRIVSSVDQDLGVTVDRNIGKVTLKGMDAELGWRASDNLMLYASASYIDSNLDSGIAGLEATTKDKQLVETPDWTWGARAQYTFNDFIQAGFQGKYVGNRFSNDGNTEIAPSYFVADADVTVNLKGIGLESTFLQINGTNIFNQDYLASISSPTGANFIPNPVGAASFSIGAPMAFQAQIKTQF